MTGPDRVGWCPSIVTPMAAHDGLLVRVKPTAATLPARALRAVAEAAGPCGNGQFDLTSRGNLQVRGLKPDTTKAFADVVVTNGLASDDPAVETVRNVAADPLGADDPDARFDSHALARALESMLADSAALRALPPKFGFLVDGGRAVPLAGARADVIVRERGGVLTIGVDGGTTAVSCTPQEAPGLAHRLARVFLALAGPANVPPFRMRVLAAEVGEPTILAEAGLAARPAVARSAPSPDAATYAAPPADSPVGYVPFAGRDRGAVIAAVPRGRVAAETLAALAGLSERHADATVRMTPWRALAFVPVNGDNAGLLLSALSDLGLITDPADPRRALHCTAVRPSKSVPAEGAAIIPETLRQ